MFYTVARFLFRWLYLLLFNIKIEGIDNVPETGGAIIASTHISNFDPVTLGFCLKRKLRFMAKEELFKVKLFAVFLRSLGAFPIKRGSRDKTAIENAAQVLRNGNLLVIFPEGTRSKSGNVGEFKPGALLIAHKAETPLVPVAIVAKKRYRLFGGIRIVFGKPLTVKDLDMEQANSKELKNSCLRLREKTILLGLSSSNKAI